MLGLISDKKRRGKKAEEKSVWEVGFSAPLGPRGSIDGGLDGHGGNSAQQ